MAKCDEGYLCEICHQEVKNIADSDLYLRYVVGLVDPETLHTQRERHLRCNPTLAQFIIDEDFDLVVVEGDLSKKNLDTTYVAERERLVTQGWRRLQELLVTSQDLPITEYPLKEVLIKLRQT